MFQFTRKNIDSFSDDELLALYKKKGDINVAGMLFDRYVHLVYGVCLKYLKIVKTLLCRSLKRSL
jgi:RNA polymerase sigma-70 factor (ECF subfamily)